MPQHECSAILFFLDEYQNFFELISDIELGYEETWSGTTAKKQCAERRILGNKLAWIVGKYLWRMTRYPSTSTTPKNLEEFFPQGQIVNVDFYYTVLVYLRKYIRHQQLRGAIGTQCPSITEDVQVCGVLARFSGLTHSFWLNGGHLFFFLKILFTNPSARAGYDTRLILKRSLTDLNSEFSFS